MAGGGVVPLEMCKALLGLECFFFITMNNDYKQAFNRMLFGENSMLAHFFNK
jgi:hypothetical protein